MKSFLAAALVTSSALATNFAVLLAGSTGYKNYRHQADVSHLY